MYLTSIKLGLARRGDTLLLYYLSTMSSIELSSVSRMLVVCSVDINVCGVSLPNLLLHIFLSVSYKSPSIKRY